MLGTKPKQRITTQCTRAGDPGVFTMDSQPRPPGDCERYVFQMRGGFYDIENPDARGPCHRLLGACPS